MTTDLFDVVKGKRDVLCPLVRRGQSGSRVHCRHQRRLAAAVPVSANYEAAPGGLQVEILLTGTVRWPLGELNWSEPVWNWISIGIRLWNNFDADFTLTSTASAVD